MHNIKEITSVSIVGAGNVGWHLSTAFHQAGIQVKNIISRNLPNAEALARSAGAEAVSLDADIKDHPDLYIISVADEAIAIVAEKFSRSPAVVAHTAGSTGLDVLLAHTDHCGVFYPLQTFTAGNKLEYDQVPFLVEGSTRKVSGLLLQLAGKISSKVRELNSQGRLKVHLAAVFACNFSTHMSAVADRLMKENGMDISLLEPLIKQTCEKLTTMDPNTAQTGPARRGDISTIGKHLEALQKKPQEKEIYELVSRNIARYGGHTG